MSSERASEEKLAEAQAQLLRLVQRQRDYLAQLNARIASLGTVSPTQAEELQAQIVLSLFTYVGDLEALVPLAATVAASLGESDLVRTRTRARTPTMSYCRTSRASRAHQLPVRRASGTH